MKYINGNSITDYWNPETTITVIGNYCIVLNSEQGSAVIVMQSPEDKKVFMDAFTNPPSCQDEPRKLKTTLHDNTYLVMTGYHGYVGLAIEEVVVYVADEDMRTLADSIASSI